MAATDGDGSTLPYSDPRTPDPDLDHGLTVVDPRFYELREEVASGGWGRILRAFDRRLGRTVAIKQLRITSDAVDARVRREARLTARLEHPAIVPVHEVGRWPTGEPFYAMKLVEGRSLREILDQAHTLAERLPFLPNVLAVADAIAYAHSKGVIHRDLKPANVMVGAFGETLVIDWGLAKEIDEPDVATAATGRRRADLTLEGSILGTPAYLAPEQARGEPVDERADVYALGAMLYALVTGHAPYEGETAQEIVAGVLAAPAPAVTRWEPRAPGDLVAIVEKAMARAPAQRYASARELAEDLHRFLTGRLVAAQRYSPGVLLVRWLRAHRRALVLAGVATAVALSLLVGFRRLRRERGVAEARREQLVLARARDMLSQDPTAAVALLKRYASGSAADTAELDRVAAEAESHGVASHVLWNLRRASIARDGNTVAGFDGDVVRLFRIDTGALRELRDPDGAILHLRFAPDGAGFATVDAGGALRLWRVADGTAQVLLRSDQRLVWLDFSRDGRFLVVTDDGGRVHRVDVASGAVLTRVARGALTAVFSPDGRTLAVAASGSVVVFRGDEPDPIRLPPPGVHEALAFAPEGDRLAWGSRQGEVVIYDLPSGPLRVLGRHPTQVTRLAFAGDGARLASSSVDGSVRLWDIPSGQGRILDDLAEVGRRLAVSPSGRFIASTGLNGRIGLCDLETGVTRQLLGHTHSVDRLQFSSDGGLLLSSDDVGQTRLWPMTAAPAHMVAPRAEHALVRAAGGVIAVLAGSTIDVWDASATAVRHLELPSAVAIGLWVSSDGRHAATVSGSDVLVVDLAGGDVHTVATHVTMQRLALAPDGQAIAVADDDNDVWLIPVGEGTPGVLHRHGVFVGMLAFSPDGKQLLSLAQDGAVLSSFAGGEPVRLRYAEQSAAAAFSPHGKQVALALASGRVWLWEPPAGRPRELGAHAGIVDRLAFSPDGATLASAGEDQAVWLWDTHSGRGRRLPHFAAVHALAFLGDGSRLATGGADGSVRLWDVAAARELAVLRVADQPLENLWTTGGVLYAVDAKHLWRVATASPAHPSLAALTSAELLGGPADLLATPSAAPRR